MDALVKHKERLIEELVTVSVDLLQTCRRGDFERIDERLASRAAILSKLQNCDKELKEPSAALNKVWTEQIHFIKKMDDEVISLMKTRKNLSNKFLSDLRKLKLELIDAYQIEPRGQQVEAKA